MEVLLGDLQVEQNFGGCGEAIASGMDLSYVYYVYNSSGMYTRGYLMQTSTCDQLRLHCDATTGNCVYMVQVGARKKINLA